MAADKKCILWCFWTRPFLIFGQISSQLCLTDFDVGTLEADADADADADGSPTVSALNTTFARELLGDLQSEQRKILTDSESEAFGTLLRLYQL